ncbi:MAG: hypothetical protein BACC_03667 [Bacteroides sp.]
MNNIENKQILNSAYKKALEQKAEWIFKIQSTILLVSFTIFAVLVSLSNSSKDNLCSQIFLSLVILSNATCILFSSITLFENRVMSNAMIRKVQEYIKEYIRYSLHEAIKPVSPILPRKRLFAICEIASYISFLFFILSLTVYAIHRLLT